jgi:cell division protein FtsB
MSDIDRTRMIPLHIADQAVAACDAEIAKLRDENARLKAEVERLTNQAERLIVRLQKSHDEHGEALYKLKYKNERQTPRKKRSS